MSLCHNMGNIKNVGKKHLLEGPETCKDMIPSGLETLESTHDLAEDPAPVLHTSPCRLSARKLSMINCQKKSHYRCVFFVSCVF